MRRRMVNSPGACSLAQSVCKRDPEPREPKNRTQLVRFLHATTPAAKHELLRC